MTEDELIRFLKKNMRIKILKSDDTSGSGFKIGIYINRPFQKEGDESTLICESNDLVIANKRPM